MRGLNVRAERADYRQYALPRRVPRVAIEAGVSAPWHRLVGEDGRVIGIDRFGESAPASQLFELFGFTATNVVNQARERLAAADESPA
jgi:transketolase